jgi:hypothetical protein
METFVVGLVLARRGKLGEGNVHYMFMVLSKELQGKLRFIAIEVQKDQF